MNDYHNNYSIIIPVRNFNSYLEKCINTILKISKKIEIIIVYDEEEFETKFSSKYKHHSNNIIKILKSEKSTISSKRNQAAKITSKKYLAFIDSDAYPSIDWIIKANTILENNKEIYCVGGPNISPNNQIYSKTAVGYAQKSFLVSGKWNYHKKTQISKFVKHIPSCNMIVRSDIYAKFNGMNENIYTGEDLDFCTKINDNSKRIYFDCKVIVYHFDRSIKNFIFQKLFRGSAVAENYKKQNILSNMYLFMPSLFLFYNIIGFLNIILNINQDLNYFFILSLNFYIIVCVIEALRYSNIKCFTLVTILIIISNFLVGIGTLLKLLNLGINKKYYNNI